MTCFQRPVGRPREDIKIKKKKELHIAPMLDVSTREFRYLMRLLTKSAVLWTEMVVDETLVHCRDPSWHVSLQRDHQGTAIEPPIICQVGGNNPEYAAMATRLVHEQGYDGIDLNCECPSHKVASNRVFGAALMKDPIVAVNVISAIQKAAAEPFDEVDSSDRNTQRTPTRNKLLVSVKMRIGVDDDMDSYRQLCEFVDRLVPHCRRLVIHARKVYTQGLNPDQNRRIPPLNYSVVYRLCRDYPDCDFILNGGIETLAQAKALLFGSDYVKPKEVHDDSFEDDDDETPPTTEDDDDDNENDDYGRNHTSPLRRAPSNLVGVMMGRAARDDPVQFWDADRYLFGLDKIGGGPVIRNRRQLFERYCSYLESVYPRRCCDDDPRITITYPSPDVLHLSLHCPLCSETPGDDAAPTQEVPSRSSSPPPTIKITSNVIDRSFKPVWGVLHNVPGSRLYRSRLFELSRNLSVRKTAVRRICCVGPSVKRFRTSYWTGPWTSAAKSKLDTTYQVGLEPSSDKEHDSDER